LTDLTNVTSVDFDISPLHGDPDIFMSITNKYPTIMNNDMVSMRVGDIADSIKFDVVEYLKHLNNNTNNITNSLNKNSITFYVGVSGFSYASF
jgi:hypothetical protein